MIASPVVGLAAASVPLNLNGLLLAPRLRRRTHNQNSKREDKADEDACEKELEHWSITIVSRYNSRDGSGRKAARSGTKGPNLNPGAGAPESTATTPDGNPSANSS